MSEATHDMTDEEKLIMSKNRRDVESRSVAGGEDCLHLAVFTPRVSLSWLTSLSTYLVMAITNCFHSSRQSKFRITIRSCPSCSSSTVELFTWEHTLAWDRRTCSSTTSSSSRFSIDSVPLATCVLTTRRSPVTWACWIKPWPWNGSKSTLPTSEAIRNKSRFSENPPAQRPLLTTCFRPSPNITSTESLENPEVRWQDGLLTKSQKSTPRKSLLVLDAQLTTLTIWSIAWSTKSPSRKSSTPTRNTL